MSLIPTYPNFYQGVENSDFPPPLWRKRLACATIERGDFCLVQEFIYNER